MRNARGSPPTSITHICLPTLASSSALAPTMALMIIRHAYQYVHLPPHSPTTTLFPRGASTHALPITLDIWARSPPVIKSACQVSQYDIKVARLPPSLTSPLPCASPLAQSTLTTWMVHLRSASQGAQATTMAALLTKFVWLVDHVQLPLQFILQMIQLICVWALAPTITSQIHTQADA